MTAETVWAGRYIVAKRDGRWEYAERASGVDAVVILAIDDGQVLLVEQYRVPLGARCLELPAGLVGDQGEAEAVETAAMRELEEETGYRAGGIESFGRFASSPGMVAESFTLVRATGLTKVGDGGGDAGEGITVHRVPLDAVSALVAAKRDEGVMIDVKLLLVLAGPMLG